MIRRLARTALDTFQAAGSLLINPVVPPVVVLIYHRVTSLAADPQLLAVGPPHFRDQMRYLKDHFPVLRFEAEWGKVREPSVVVTFDDGYADNYLEALPILEQEQVPATFFVTTGGLGTKDELWWDELERLLLGGGDFPASLALPIEGKNYRWETATAAGRRRCYDQLHPLLRGLPPATLQDAIAAIRNWAGLGREGRESHRPLTADEVRLLSQSAWATIGAHCVNHPRLCALSAEEQRDEILASKRRLEEICGREITVFSYPFGCPGDFTRESVRICRDAGFRRVAANFPGQARPWTDPMQIPRQLVRDWGVTEFAARLDRFLLV
ncbi:polysaccharide deacetylase [Geomonas sp. Red276]